MIFGRISIYSTCCSGVVRSSFGNDECGLSFIHRRYHQELTGDGELAWHCVINSRPWDFLDMIVWRHRTILRRCSWKQIIPKTGTLVLQKVMTSRIRHVYIRGGAPGVALSVTRATRLREKTTVMFAERARLYIIVSSRETNSYHHAISQWEVGEKNETIMFSETIFIWSDSLTDMGSSTNANMDLES